MTTTQEMKATARPQVGKGAARATRRTGRVPGVIYGDKKPPLPISLDITEVNKRIYAGHFLTTVYDLDIDGEKHRVIPRAFQLDPVKDKPVHVDFQRLAAGAVVRVQVPVRFVNHEASPGLKRGGVLNVVRHELELVCESDKIPDEITIDVTGLEVGDAIHISSVTLPDGSESFITDRDFTIATVVAPSALKQSDAAAGEEGEEEAGEGEASAS